jgi:hypothetical protein
MIRAYPLGAQLERNIVSEAPKYRLDRIENAASRLERAIGRLELAIAARPQGGSKEISSDLAELRAENENLRRTTTKVATRLDTAIAKLDAALGD